MSIHPPISAGIRIKKGSAVSSHAIVGLWLFFRAPGIKPVSVVFASEGTRFTMFRSESGWRAEFRRNPIKRY